MANMKAIVSVTNDLTTDQRVHKVCTFLVQQGYDVLLVGRKKTDSLPLAPRNYATHRMRFLVEKGAFFYAFFNLRLFFFLLFRKSSLLVANDLDTLLPNFLISKMKGCRLVYDSHEFFTEVPELIHRPKIRAVWLRIEQFIFPKLKTIITVNESIAKQYHERYGKQLVVVRNVSPLWNPELPITTKEQLGIPSDSQLLIMQGAGLNRDRGIEEAIHAMSHLEETVLLLVGNGDSIPAMKELVEAQQLQEKVLFFDKRPYSEMMCFTFHADLGLSFDQPTNPNYCFSLPNKIFDYLHAGTPILCSDVIEVATLVRKYDIGCVVTDFSPESLAKQIGDLLSNTERMNELKDNCKFAAIQENWEKETSILEKIYLNNEQQ